MANRNVELQRLETLKAIVTSGINAEHIPTIAETLLAEIMRNGIAAATKTMYDVAIVHSIDSAMRKHEQQRLSDLQMGLLLRVSAQKVRSLRYQADLHYAADHDQEAKLQFLAYLSRAVVEQEGMIVRLQVSSRLARSWIHDRIERMGHGHDSSFNTDVVKIRPATLIILLKDVSSSVLPDQASRHAVDQHVKQLQRMQTVEGISDLFTTLKNIPILRHII